jgi:hypothetical protein
VTAVEFGCNEGDVGMQVQLRKLELSELRLGRELPGHLRDREGNVIVEAGLRLTEARLRILAKCTNLDVHVGPDWPIGGRLTADEEEVSPEEIKGFLQRQVGTRDDLGHMRGNERRTWNAEITVILRVSEGHEETDHELRVTTRDISKGGFSFVADRYIHAGTCLFAQIGGAENQSIIKGIVRNCQYIEGRQHRIGVEFSRRNPGEQLPTCFRPDRE